MKTTTAAPSTGTAAYYAHDNLGSTRSIYDSGKTQDGQLEYTPYGSPYLASVDSNVTRRFTGHQLDADTGSYSTAFREYSPLTNRWSGRDPLGMVDGPNMYGYVGGNPINYVDPLGLNMGGLDDLQDGLDLAGFIPGIGTFADLANAGIYASQGDWGNAALSGLAAVPVLGIFSGAAKIAKKVKRRGNLGYMGCFTEDTLVATPDGDRPIADISIGDEVYTYDEQTGEIIIGTVSGTFTRTADAIIELTIADEDGTTYEILGTADHPFYVPAENGYIELGELNQGNVLQTFDGTLAIVQELDVLAGPFEVYNFEVEGTHNYFVASVDGGPLTLVHNMCGPRWTRKMLSTAEPIAVGSNIDDLARLLRQYKTRQPQKWKKMKGWDSNNQEWHWYYHPKVGKVEAKEMPPIRM